MTQAQLLIQAFFLIVKSKVCPDTPIRDWVKILLFLHKKGYLWCKIENDKLVTVAAAYRIKKFTKKATEVYPEKEAGNILYVAFMASVAEDKMSPKKMLTAYLEKHPKVREILFHDYQDNEKLKKFKRGGKNVQEKVAGNAGNTKLPGRSPVHAGVR